jgi:hypothetical protein
MYSEQAQQNPVGARDGIARVARGGGAGGLAPQCRVSTRKSLYQGGTDDFTGFRLAMDYDIPPTSDTARKATPEPTTSDKTPAADSAKVSLRALLAADHPYDTVQTSVLALLAAEKAAERQRRKARLNALPLTTFLTLNAAYTSMPQWSYGFKVGMVKVFGWYFSAMTNFQYKGAFSSFQQNQLYALTGLSKTTYLGGQVGLVVRPCTLVSCHVGAGFGYRTLNFECDQGWHNFPKRTYYGPTASLGVMFHVWHLALSAEATSMVYNLNSLNDIRYAIGARIGIGFTIHKSQFTIHKSQFTNHN